MAEQQQKPGVDEMYCASCGAIIKRAAEICPKCGVRVTYRPMSPVAHTDRADRSHRSRVAAGILGVLLGGLGVHRFYLGHIGVGIIQIVVTVITFGFGAIWGFIEGIIILADGNFRDGEGKFLRHYNE